jgi:TatD DNase family protein
MKYIDIHSHLGQEDYGADLASVYERMRQAEVGTITIGTTLADSTAAVKLAENHDNVWACIGVHPKTGSEPVFDEIEFEKLVVHSKVVAIGECGLDYFKLEGDIEKIKAKQKEIFIKQVEFAIKHDKPLMLHLRDGEVKRQSYQDVYDILSEFKKTAGDKLRGNLHFFTANLEWAQKFIALGFTISFIGLITYVEDFNKIIRGVPLTALQAETDAPYVAPVPHRGERNEPSYVMHVYNKIAEIRGEEPEMVRQTLLSNAERLFCLK